MRSEAKILAGLLLFPIIAAFTAISSQSLWIDEANSAVKAMAPTWAEFVARMSVERGSDLQMPGYMAILWGWTKIFGSGEVALRALNGPFFLGALGLVFFSLKASLRTRVFFVLFSCSSAFLWFYLNEARPYVYQFFGATLGMTGLYNMALSKRGHLVSGDAIMALLGLLVLLSASLSTLFFVALLGLTFLLLVFRLAPFRQIIANRSLTTTFLLVGLSGFALAVYYLWTLKVGAKASSVGKTTPVSMLFCLYELAGCYGMGPSRSALRESPVVALRPFALPLAIYAAIVIGFLCTSLNAVLPEIRRIPRSLWFLGGAVIAALLMVFALGVLAEFRVVGRHLMPAFPFVILALSLGADLTIRQHRTVGILLPGLFITAGLVSSLQLRTAGRHAKDDYRDAARDAKSILQQGGSVWWAADKAGAEYYGLSPRGALSSHDTNTKGSITLLQNEKEETLQSWPTPQLVVASKKDIYDAAGALQNWLKEHHYSIQKQYPSFEIWRCH